MSRLTPSQVEQVWNPYWVEQQPSVGYPRHGFGIAEYFCGGGTPAKTSGLVGGSTPPMSMKSVHQPVAAYDRFVCVCVRLYVSHWIQK